MKKTMKHPTRAKITSANQTVVSTAILLLDYLFG